MHLYVRMNPLSNNITYEEQDPNMYINPQVPTYVVSGAVGTASSLRSMSSPLSPSSSHIIY